MHWLAVALNGEVSRLSWFSHATIRHALHVVHFSIIGFELHFMNIDPPRCAGAEPGQREAAFRNRLQTHVLKDRQPVTQRHCNVVVIQFEPRDIRRVIQIYKEGGEVDC